jgi:hypothetical protein
VQVVLANVPVLLVVKLTVPVGVPELDETVAVQLVGVLSSTLAGEQLTVVLVAATVKATMKVPLLPV